LLLFIVDYLFVSQGINNTAAFLALMQRKPYIIYAGARAFSIARDLE